MRRRGHWGLLGSMVGLLLVGVAWAADPMVTRFRTITVGDANERLDVSANVPLKSVTVYNNGDADAYVDFDGSGIASPGKATSHLIRAGLGVTFEARVTNHEIRVIGAIAPGGTATLDLHLGE